jgi:hypothetical protein
MDNYNNCEETEDCAKGEDCFVIGLNNVCAPIDCTTDDDCPAANSGDAEAICVQVTKEGDTACALSCADGEDCPNGMLCAGDFACAWPTAGMCPDDTIDGDLPVSIEGDITGLVDDVIPSCGDGGGEEALLEFTADEAGIYLFDTIDSAYDTVLFVQTACGGDQITCNDDLAMGNTDSRVGVQLAADQTIIVGVDSYNGAVGAYNLNVEYNVGSDAGSCCDENDMGGCDDMDVETCVCDIDDFCCDTAWDATCISLVPVCLGLCE